MSLNNFLLLLVPVAGTLFVLAGLRLFPLTPPGSHSQRKH